MILLFPVFFRQAEEEAILLATPRADHPGSPLVARAWQSLAASPGDLPVVASDRPEVLVLAREHGLPVLAMETARPGPGSPFLPPGSAQALAQARDTGLVQAREPLAVVDCRHVLLDPAALALALAALMPAGSDLDQFLGRPAVSVALSEDHPIQLQEHLALAWTETLVPLDPGFRFPRTGPIRPATRPFPFQWPFYLDSAFFLEKPPARGFYALLSHRENPAGLQFVPEDLAQAFDPALFFRRATLFYQDRAQARRVLDTVVEPGTAPVPALPEPWQVLAVPVLPSGASVCLLARDRNTGRLALFVRRSRLRAGLILRLALHRQGREQVQEQRLAPRDLRQALEIPWGEDAPPDSRPDPLIGPLAVGPAPDNERVDFFSVLALTRAAKGAVDRCEPLQLTGSLWRRLPSTLQAVNARTGRVVSGRQMFPPVYEPDGGLALGRARDLLALAQGRVLPLAGFVLAPEHRCRVDSAFGLLALKAKLRSLGREVG